MNKLCSCLTLWSSIRDLNSYQQLGRLLCYHYTNTTCGPRRGYRTHSSLRQGFYRPHRLLNGLPWDISLLTFYNYYIKNFKRNQISIYCCLVNTPKISSTINAISQTPKTVLKLKFQSNAQQIP